jgi:hypothetical protein
MAGHIVIRITERLARRDSPVRILYAQPGSPVSNASHMKVAGTLNLKIRIARIAAAVGLIPLVLS